MDIIILIEKLAVFSIHFFIIFIKKFFSFILKYRTKSVMYI